MIISSTQYSLPHMYVCKLWIIAMKRNRDIIWGKGGASCKYANPIVHVVVNISSSTDLGLQRGGVALNAFDDVRSLRAQSDDDK